MLDFVANTLDLDSVLFFQLLREKLVIGLNISAISVSLLLLVLPLTGVVAPQ